MDWIDEKVENLRQWVRNLSFRKAMVAYIFAWAAAAALCSYVTMILCFHLEVMIGQKYDTHMSWLYAVTIADFVKIMGLYGDDDIWMALLNTVRLWCPFIYSIGAMIAAVQMFYRNRLKKPLSILKKGTEEIKKNNLDFPMYYDSEDELGSLCVSFEDMRQELIKNKNDMWMLVENQKEINAAFAHDLRTPLTVLKGYSQFLARYIPEEKVSQEKMIDTLKLMSGNIERLELFSRTMKGIRSIDEMPLRREKTDAEKVKKEIREVAFALDQIGDINIMVSGTDCAGNNIYLDMNIIMEVLENLLSNAIRYARTTIEVQLACDQRELYMAVRDDGRGFSEEELTQAVEPYYREHGEADAEHFGIGLHICRRLCEKHGGRLGIANSLNGGAIVTASFSLKDESRDS